MDPQTKIPGYSPEETGREWKKGEELEESEKTRK